MLPSLMRREVRFVERRGLENSRGAFQETEHGTWFKQKKQLEQNGGFGKVGMDLYRRSWFIFFKAQIVQ